MKFQLYTKKILTGSTKAYKAFPIVCFARILDLKICNFETILDIFSKENFKRFIHNPNRENLKLKRPLKIKKKIYKFNHS